MATIKSYTDLEQSKKLAEILPLESADMWYHGHNGPMTSDMRFDDEPAVYHSLRPNWDIPCWSLAALISIIPQELFDGEYIINITEGRDNKWVLTYDHYEKRNHSFYGLSTGADNLADACYEMILKFTERKML